MNKYMFLGAGLCVAMVLTSCGSSESAYKKAYLKAQQRTEAQQTTPTVTTPAATETPTVTPVTTTPVTETRIVDNTDATPIRSERVEVQSGAALKAYSVVVGSFQLRGNAEGEVQRLINKPSPRSHFPTDCGVISRWLASASCVTFFCLRSLRNVSFKLISIKYTFPSFAIFRDHLSMIIIARITLFKHRKI